jgi:hypothetical protein
VLSNLGAAPEQRGRPFSYECHGCDKVVAATVEFLPDGWVQIAPDRETGERFLFCDGCVGKRHSSPYPYPFTPSDEEE